MLLTTALLYNAMRDIWRWPVVTALLVSGVFLVADFAFIGRASPARALWPQMEVRFEKGPWMAS
jgi:K+ transporter